MKVIAVEEHFFPVDVPGIIIDGGPPLLPGSHRGSVWEKDPSTLKEIGPKRIASMDEAGIDMQILSAPVGGGFAPEVAVDYCQKINNYQAERIEEYPDRFKGYATLPTSVPEACAQELERCVKELGFVGTLIGNRTNDCFLSEPQYDPLLAKAEELGVPVFVHPSAAPRAVADACYSKGLSKKVSTSFQLYGYGWHVDTGIHFLNLILSGAFDRHPDLQVILGHWGELTPYFMDRLDENLSKEFAGTAHDPSYYFRHNLYITSSGVWTPECLEFCVKRIGADRILFSQDYPFGDPNGQDKILSHPMLSEEDRERIAHGNAMRLFKLPS